jgi:hypothetical protein
MHRLGSRPCSQAVLLVVWLRCCIATIFAHSFLLRLRWNASPMPDSLLTRKSIDIIQIHSVNCSWVRSYELNSCTATACVQKGFVRAALHAVCIRWSCSSSGERLLSLSSFSLLKKQRILSHQCGVGLFQFSLHQLTINVLPPVILFFSSTRMLLKFCPRTASSQTRIPHRYYISY